MTDITARLESATEGSRELDAWVHAPADTVEIHVEHARSGTYYEAIDGEGVQIWLLGESDFPAYTTSLDAALTLVPEECNLSLEIASFQNAAWVHRPGHSVSSDYGTMRSPALALCIAALKARGAAA